MASPQEPVRIVVPTQLPIATTNVYLLKGQENAIIDTGPHHPESWKHLTRGLRSEGLELEDLDIAVITHGHVDHYGQAGDIVEASGAEVWVPEKDKNAIADFAIG